MQSRLLLSLFFISIFYNISAQINPQNIEIVRDQWGVPHIYAETDIEVAYGLGWASSEDDFKTIQHQLLGVRGLAGEVLGKSGAILDVAIHILEAKSVVDKKYETDLSDHFKKYVEAYAAGVNAYAQKFPKEVLHKKLFPVSGKDVIVGYVLGMALMSGASSHLENLMGNKVEAKHFPTAEGSNAIAISKNKTTDGKTYLAVNSHQPLEGLYSWYEAHLCSEEGLNILGGTFAGSPTIFLGTNENLGWAHTVNHADFSDVYELKMNPKNKNQYEFDGQWLDLESYHTKARIKLMGFLKIGLKQKFYKSKYGVTFKTKKGVFALRLSANRNIQAAEQWYKMNKATNFEEFMDALRMQGIICTNIVYADKEDHIYYVSNGRLPKRNPKYNWLETLPGNTSATLWKDEYYPLDSLPHVIDPPSGYVYNCNHTPFLSSDEMDNPKVEDVPVSMGFQTPDKLTNRSVRFYHLINQYDKLSYEDFKTIKYDRAFHKPLKATPKLEKIFELDEKKYPDIAQSILLLKSWDRVADEESKAASIFILSFGHVWEAIGNVDAMRKGDLITEALLVEAVRSAQKHLIKHFDSATIPLKTLQRHTREDVDISITGAPDVLAAMYAQKQKNGTIRAVAGDSYIQLVRYSENGVEIESVNAYGAAAKEGHPHSTDQMDLFSKLQLKKMTLDKEVVFKNAKKVYHPG